MAEYSSILLENAVESLSKLPGIGKKTALRLALHLLNSEDLETEQLDVLAIERTASYNGLYHVLGGVISPIEGISPNDLKITQLVQRTQKEDIKEIILALPATIEGDTTNFYIFRQLKGFEGKISVISKGIAVGDALEYVDEVTLGRSIQNRIPFNSH